MTQDLPTKLRIRYLFTFPFSMDIGGGGQIIKDIIKNLKNNHFCEFFDYESTQIDFDIFIIFGCTYLNPHLMQYYKNKGVKIILYPIFDRMQPVWKMKIANFLIKAPVLNIYKLRSQIFNASDTIIVANDSERRDLVDIYKCDNSKIKTLYYGINDLIVRGDKKVGVELFQEKYPGWKNFVFCPAAAISSRKNQISLIKALKNTDIKLVINNSHKIIDDLEGEFKSLTINNPNILCLEQMELDMMISCYKNAKVSVSVSQAETAGLVNLEAGFLGCNLVVSDLEALREYLGNFAIFVDQNSEESIKTAIIKAMNTDYNPKLKEFILDNYTWDKYIIELLVHIENIKK